MSINGRIDKQIVIYCHNGVVLGNRKEGIMDIINNMNKSPKHYAESKKLDQKEKKNIPSDFICMKFKLKFYGDKNENNVAMRWKPSRMGHERTF